MLSTLIVALILVSAAAFSPIDRFYPGSSNRTETFRTFLEQFPLVSLPYALTKRQMMQEKPVAPKTRSTSSTVKDPEQFIPKVYNEWISRNPVYKYPEARMETAGYVVVICKTSQGFRRGCYYEAIVFDHNGRFVSRNFIAGKGAEIKAMTLEADLRATICVYQIKWKETDVHEKPSGKITGLTLQNTYTVDLTKPTAPDGSELPKGKIDPIPAGPSPGTVIISGD